jgi:hypothetical protein
LDILSKYKIYEENNGVTLNTLYLKVKYKINNQFRYNKFTIKIPNVIKWYYEIHNIKIPDDLNDFMDCFNSSLDIWNKMYEESFNIIKKVGIKNIVKDLIIDDIKENHESDIAYSTYKKLIKSLTTENKYKTFNFQIDKDKMKL